MNPGQRASAHDIRRLFPPPGYTDEDVRYLDYHAARIAFAINVLDGCIRRVQAVRPGAVRVLDVGPHFLTAALRAWFGGAITLATLGWANERLAPAHLVDRHYAFDLNQAHDPDHWPARDPYDIVVMAEVIEHLYTSPRLVLRFLASFLAEPGLMLIQTPNAVSLHHRLKMLFGRNPFEPIRDARDNPGHFREYTAAELKHVCRDAGLVPEKVFHVDYWPTRLILRPVQWLYPRLRSGISLLARKG